MNSIAIVALLCVLAQTAYAAPDKVDCTKIDEYLDDLGSAQAMTVLNDKYLLATSADLQKKRCTEMADAIKMLRKYNKECFSSLTQQVLSAVLRTRSQFNEPRCGDSNAAEFKAATEAAKCVAEKTIDTVKEAEKKTIVAFQVLNEAAIPDDKLRVRRACCAVTQAKQVFLDATKAKCVEHQQIYADYVDSYTSEAMGLICPAEDKLDCASLEKIKTDGVTPKYKFFLTPMIKLVKTLDH